LPFFSPTALDVLRHIKVREAENFVDDFIRKTPIKADPVFAVRRCNSAVMWQPDAETGSDSAAIQEGIVDINGFSTTNVGCIADVTQFSSSAAKNGSFSSTPRSVTPNLRSISTAYTPPTVRVCATRAGPDSPLYGTPRTVANAVSTKSRTCSNGGDFPTTPR